MSSPFPVSKSLNEPSEKGRTMAVVSCFREVIGYWITFLFIAHREGTFQTNPAKRGKTRAVVRVWSNRVLVIFPFHGSSQGQAYAGFMRWFPDGHKPEAPFFFLFFSDRRGPRRWKCWRRVTSGASVSVIGSWVGGAP